MSLWRPRDGETVSRSMVALVISCAAALVLGVVAWAPRWLAADDAPTPVAPGLLQVAPTARAQVPLGGGMTVRLDGSGLRIARGTIEMLDTVTKASPISVVTGTPGTSGPDRIDTDLSNLRIDTADVGTRRVVWRGTAYGNEGLRGRTVPVTITATRVDRTVRLAISAPAADGLVLHLDVRPNTRGVTPQLPDRNLRKRSWWVSGDGTGLFTNILLGQTGVEAPGARRAVDLRPDGLLDIHVWSPDPVLTLTPTATPTTGDVSGSA